MRKITFFFIFSCVFVFGQSERILDFRAKILVEKSSTIRVTENIKVYSTGNEIRHGIFRSIPLGRSLAGKNIPVKTKIISVKQDGEKADYHTEKEDMMMLYIGSKDIDISTGIHNYEITYTATNQIGFFDKYDELYWNVTGNYWDFPIDHCEAEIIFPTDAKILQNACYTGEEGSTEKNCNSQVLAKNKIKFSADSLQSKEGLTIAAGIQKNVIPEPPPPGFLEKFWMLGLVVLVFIFGGNYLYKLWEKFGKDTKKPVVIPQFSPPQNLSPAAIGYIANGDSDELIAASFTNLAVKKFIKIDEKKDGEFTITTLEKDTRNLPEEEKRIMTILFSDVEITTTIKPKYSRKIEGLSSSFFKILRGNYKKLNETTGNYKKSAKIGGYFLIIVAILSLIYSLIVGDDYSLIFALPMLCAFEIFFIGGIYLLLSRFKFFEYLYFAFIAFVSYYYLSKIFGGTNPDKIAYNSLLFFTVVGSLVFAIFVKLMRVANPEKIKLETEIKGFKMYLETTEEKLMQFANPPKMTPEIFEKYLPYAMVLGIDDIWGEKFQAILQTMSVNDAEIYRPKFSPSAFTTNFTETLNRGSYNPETSSSSYSGSSSSSSSSSGGSSGSGSSGGGGGGGGGGGW